MVSAGTPMITGGDEHLRSLNCNNTPYNLDSVGNWLSYSFTKDEVNFRTFAQRLIAFRTLHPALRPRTWYASQVQWYTPAGTVADAEYWNDSSNHAIAWEMDGNQFGDPASAIYVAYNGWSGGVKFAVAKPGTG
jgi:glycogen operon protein